MKGITLGFILDVYCKMDANIHIDSNHINSLGVAEVTLTYTERYWKTPCKATINKLLAI